MESWFIQTGIGLGPALFGLYWDHFAFTLGEAQNLSHSQAAQPDIKRRHTHPDFRSFLRGSPAIGRSHANGHLQPVGLFQYRSFHNQLSRPSVPASLHMAEAGRPGKRHAAIQYPISSSTSFGLWCNYSWMRLSQDADLDFENIPIPLLSRSRTVTPTMTKYIVGGGVTLGVNF